MTEVTIVGAGILGLSTALTLVESGKYYVKIVAEFGPHTETKTQEYTSHWAGAHFRPAPVAWNNVLPNVEMTRVTMRRMFKFADDPESGVVFMTGVEFFENLDGYLDSNGDFVKSYTGDIPEFQTLKSDQFPHSGEVTGTEADAIKFGTSYLTWVINPHIFLRYLYQKLYQQGVQFSSERLESLLDVDSSIIINCSGKGLRSTPKGPLYDPSVIPIRGQTLIVDPGFEVPKTYTTQSNNGKDWTFLIPRPRGGVILGGTKQVGDTHGQIRETDTQELLRRGKLFYPWLFEENLKVTGINLGFRPSRNDGIRLEKDKVGNKVVIHNYGAGGMGYELSFGSAARVLELLEVKARL